MFNLNRPWRTREGIQVQHCFFFNLGARWNAWSTPPVGRSTPGKETRYPFYKGLVCPRVGLDRCEKPQPCRASIFGTSWPWRVFISTIQTRPTMILSTLLCFKQTLSDISKCRSVETSVTICIYRPTRCNIHKTRIFSTVALRTSTLTRYRLWQSKRLNSAV